MPHLRLKVISEEAFPARTLNFLAWASVCSPVDFDELVGDGLDHLVLLDLQGAQAALEVLLSHGTSWHTQESHCHPTFS